MIKDSLTYQVAIKHAASIIHNENSKVLVTGASGLIGSCIVDILLAANKFYGKNFEIFVMSRKKSNLTDRFISSDHINFIVQNVTDPINIDGLDYIIHAASIADPVNYARHPTETIITNVLGAKSILDYCKNKHARVLLTSSFEIYGQIDSTDIREDQYGVIDLNLIRSCYPESKRTSEMLFKSYCYEYGVDVVIARLSSIYGPTMKFDDSKAHAQFIRNALHGKNIVLKSKGSQIRTYCYVMDAATALLTVLFNGKSGESYNVANSVTSIANLANIFAQCAGTKVVYDLPNEFEKIGYSTPCNCALNTAKLKKLGWYPRYDLNEGCTETLVILKESLCLNH